MASWKTILADYQFILWDAKRFDVNSTLWTKQAFKNKKYAFVSDYIRFYAVYRYGGIYLDADVEVIKNFDDLLHLPYFIGSQYDNFAEPAVFGTEKQSDWVLDCLNYYNNRAFKKEDGRLDMLVLPKVMQSQIEKNKKIIQLKINDVGDIYKLAEDNKMFYLFPQEYFSPKNHQTGKLTKSTLSYTIHHYNASWLPPFSKLKLAFTKSIGVERTEKIISAFGIIKLFNIIKKAQLKFKHT